MTEGTSQGLFIVVAIVIFGIFVGLSYNLFGKTLQPALVNLFETALNVDVEGGEGPITPPVTPPVTPETPPVDLEEAVIFGDKNLEKAVRETLGLDATEIIKVGKMQGMTSLRADDVFIKSLSGLEHASNLGFLKITVDNSTDLTPLSKLKKLKNLDSYGSKLTDYTPIARLTQLEQIRIGSSNDVDKITDISFLKNLTNLKVLDLLNNKISEIDSLAKLTNLTRVYLTQNKVTDLSPLSNSTKITILELSSNNITDLEPLSNMTELTNLNLFNNKINDVKALANLKNLKELNLTLNKQITDFTLVEFVPKLSK